MEVDKTVRRDVIVARNRKPRRRLGRLRFMVWAVLLALPLAAAVGQAQEPSPTIETSQDMVRNGLFKGSPAAIQGRTVRGETILDAPLFNVLPRSELLELFPCNDCHEGEPANPRERVLKEEHEKIVLEHGSGRFWCLTCHDSKDKNTLTSLKKKAIDFNQAYILCGQCHFQRQKDWYFGGHGKRAGAFPVPREIVADSTELLVSDRETIGTWRDERTLLSCPTCHDSHSPSIKKYKPAPPPLVRKGLQPARLIHHETEAVWVRLGKKEGKPRE